MSFAPPTCRMPLGQSQCIPQADPGRRVNPRFWHRLIRFRHFIDGSLALASLNRACRDHVPTFPQRSPPWLVWAFHCQAVFRAAISLSCFLDRFLCSIWNPVSSPRPAVLQKPTRAGAVKVGRRTNLSTPSALARPYLDSSEHGGTLDAVGMTIRGEPAFGRADQSRHILVFGGSKGSEP